jgi:hypothetical protein
MSHALSSRYSALSTPPSARMSSSSTAINLPGDGVYLDSTAFVTYWQDNLADALN